MKIKLLICCGCPFSADLKKKKSAERGLFTFSFSEATTTTTEFHRNYSSYRRIIFQRERERERERIPDLLNSFQELLFKDHFR
jgi:hypothetical protein